MTDISDADDLLAIARESLLRDVLPALPANRRYAVLMIANAMAIASREGEQGAVAAEGEAAELLRLLASIDGARDDLSAGTSDRLSRLRHAMKAAIREGRFDAPSLAAKLSAALLEATRAWVAISNPKALRPTAVIAAHDVS
jgi:hypothetical protein